MKTKKSAVAIRPQPGWQQGGWQPPRKTSPRPKPTRRSYGVGERPRFQSPTVPLMILPAMFTMVLPFIIPTRDQHPGECVWEFCVVGRIGLFAVAVLHHTGRGFRLRDNEACGGPAAAVSGGERIWTPGGV